MQQRLARTLQKALNQRAVLIQVESGEEPRLHAVQQGSQGAGEHAAALLRGLDLPEELDLAAHNVQRGQSGGKEATQFRLAVEGLQDPPRRLEEKTPLHAVFWGFQNQVHLVLPQRL